MASSDAILDVTLRCHSPMRIFDADATLRCDITISDANLRSLTGVGFHLKARGLGDRELLTHAGQDGIDLAHLRWKAVEGRRKAVEGGGR